MVSRLSYITTDAALSDARQFAGRILYADKPSRNSSTINHNHYHWGPSWGWGWGYLPQPVYCGPYGSRGEKKDHSWVAIPATIIALGTLYFIGQNHAEWSIASDDIEALKQANQAVRIELSHAHPALKSTVFSVFQKQMAILDELKKSALTGLLLKGLLCTSVILAGVGGLASGGILFAASLEPLLEYGTLSAFLAAAAMLYRAGFNSTDRSVQGKALDLQLAVERAERVLHEIS